MAITSTNKPMITGEIILSRMINGEMVHLYNIKRKEQTHEEWKKEHARYHNTIPRLSTWLNDKDDNNGNYDEFKQEVQYDQTSWDDLTDSECDVVDPLNDESSFSD